MYGKIKNVPNHQLDIITLDIMGLCLGIWEHPERQVSWSMAHGWPFPVLVVNHPKRNEPYLKPPAIATSPPGGPIEDKTWFDPDVADAGGF